MTTTSYEDGASAEERKRSLNVSMLEIGGRRCSRAGRGRAYVRKERLDDVEVGDLCALDKRRYVSFCFWCHHGALPQRRDKDSVACEA